jgi:hypothetical protein
MDELRPQDRPEGTSEAELLAWLLDREAHAARPRAELERSEDDARRLAELERFVTRCRAASERFEELGAGRRRHLVERVLASTTREDLSWRGDLRLFGRFALQRLRTSPALRLAAASLLVHLLALPVVAWYGLSRLEAERETTIRFERLLPVETEVEETGETLPELDAEAPDPLDLELEPAGRDPELYVENSLSWARLQQTRPLPPAPPAAEDEGRAAELLRARWAVLGGEEPAAVSPAPPADGAPLALRALWAELLLDRALRSGEAPAGLARTLGELGADRLSQEPGGVLAAAALARAESYGMLPAGAADALWQARLDLAGFPDAAGLVEGGRDLRRVAPLDARWRAAVVAARAELDLPDGWVAALEPR